MADKTINTKVRLRYDSEANWKSKDPVLLSGEMAISSDKNGMHKVGNGTSKWSALSYVKASLDKNDVVGALGYTPPTSNTWRGIQNNLTSDATDQSLAAAQGKVLKGLIDGKAASSHTHDDRYYTESEINTKLSVKADSSNAYLLKSFSTVPENGDLNTYITPGTYGQGQGSIAQTIKNLPYSSSYWEFKLIVEYMFNNNSAYLMQKLFRYNTSEFYVRESHDSGKTWLAWRKFAQTGDFASASVNYANSSGTATKLSSSAGSSSQPVYFSDGKPVAIGYTISSSVPSNAVFTDTNTWRPLGTTADTACAGNDSRLSNARPASDVYSWAKASSKPSYSWSEITGKPSTFTPGGHNHYLLTTIGDARGTATTPNTYSNTLIFQGLKNNSTIGISNGGIYSYVLGLRGWSDSSGGNSHELAFNDNGIYTRKGATTSWEGWRTLIDSSNYTSYTVSKTGTGASGTWGINITGSAGSVAWSNINNKPSTFTPESHTHTISQITNLQSTLDNKANSTHTHSYLPLSGGTLTGDLKIPIEKSTIDGSVPYSGSNAQMQDIRDFVKYKSYIGTAVSTSNVWWNIISVRHRNGADTDGSTYGMAFYTSMKDWDVLYWNKQIGKDNWIGDRIIIDSPNVINNLTSTSTTFPLSANQGRVLNSKISGKYILHSYVDISINEDGTGLAKGKTKTITKTISHSAGTANVYIILSTYGVGWYPINGMNVGNVTASSFNINVTFLNITGEVHTIGADIRAAIYVKC